MTRRSHGGELTCDRQVDLLVVGFFSRLDQTLVGPGVADPEAGDLVRLSAENLLVGISSLPSVTLKVVLVPVPLTWPSRSPGPP